MHISLVGPDKMRISWITKLSIMPTVVYGTVSGKYVNSANGTSSSYHYLRIYQSGQINDVVIGPLKPNTVYYYKCGGTYSTQEFNFKTPPSQFPIKFAVAGTLHIPFFLIRSYTKRTSFHKILLCSSIRFFLLMFLKIDKKKNEGDLGTTEWTQSTLDHLSKWEHDVFVLPGDLSYADFIQPVWDTFGRLVQPLASRRPWMVTQGNHEVERIPLLHRQSFTAYNHRYTFRFIHDLTKQLTYSFHATWKINRIISSAKYYCRIEIYIIQTNICSHIDFQKKKKIAFVLRFKFVNADFFYFLFDASRFIYFFGFKGFIVM